MSKAKNAVANGNPKRYSDSTSNLNSFRPFPLKGEVCEPRKEASAVTAPKTIILIMDELGARIVDRIPTSIARNLDMYHQDVFDHGVQMFTKRDTAHEEKEISIIDGELHPLEVIHKSSVFKQTYFMMKVNSEGKLVVEEIDPSDRRSHHHKRLSKLNAGHVVRRMDRQTSRAAFAV